MNVLGLFTAFSLLIVVAAIFTSKKPIGPKTETFAKGDAVTAFGNKGIVKSISSNGMFVEVQFDGVQNTTLFELDGRYMKWNKRSSLVKL